MAAPTEDDRNRRAREAVEQVVATLEHAQQHELVEEFIGLFRRDATWVTGGGHRMIGRDTIAAFTREVLPGAMTSDTASYDVEHVTFARPDVAIVSVRQRPVTLNGRPITGRPEGRPTYVMTAETDGWKIVAGQNTAVHSD